MAANRPLRICGLLDCGVCWHARAVEHPSTSSESTDSAASLQKRPKVNHELLHRIYNRSEYTAIVRAIGPETWDIEDGRDLIVPLMKWYGVECVLDATHELLAIESNEKQTTARLTDEVRRYAVQILGNGNLPLNTEAVSTSNSKSSRDRLKRLRLSDDAAREPASDYIQVLPGPIGQTRTPM